MAARILIAVGLFVALGVGTVIFVWLYRQRLMIVFGLAPPPGRRREGDDEEVGQQPRQPLPARNSGGAIPVAIGKKVSSGTASSSSSDGGAASGPMIVVTEDQTSKGELLTYQSCARACSNWADGQLLGSGQAAKVYQGELPRFGKVAVKRFHAAREQSGRDFSRELDALAQSRHPNILEIFGRSIDGPENLIVMPLMEGGTLRKGLPNMRWAPRAVVLGQIVRSVSFLHGKSMVHRDIKSTNILLDRSLRHARLADFGLAKDQVQPAGHGTTGIVVGSPGYMAPELMMRPASEKTDAFALGVVFLEALTGLPAWDDASQGEMSLTDRAVVEQIFQEQLIDRSAAWPPAESAVVSSQAVAMTLFDPSRRRLATAIEGDAAYLAHVERADKSMNGQ